MRKEFNKMADHGVKFGYLTRLFGSKSSKVVANIVVIPIVGIVALLVGFFLGFFLKRDN